MICVLCLSADDPYLIYWTKLTEPWLAEPQVDLPLNCWRDPFVLERPSSSNGERWRVVIGSGIKQPPLLEPSTPGESFTFSRVWKGYIQLDCLGWSP